MSDFLTVLKYTFYENLRRKAVIISTIIIVLLTVIVVSIPGISELLKDKGTKSTNPNTSITEQNNVISGTVYVIDSKGIIKNLTTDLQSAIPGYRFETVSVDQLESLKEKVEKDKNLSIMLVDEKDGMPYFEYMVKQSGRGLTSNGISVELKKAYSASLLKSVGVTNYDVIQKVVVNDIESKETELGKGMLKSIISSMIIMMLLFFAIYFYGYGVSMSVASEKTSRVMEILVTSTKPSRIILGKSTAMGLLGLCQFFTVVLSAFITYKLTFPKNFTFMGQSIDFSNFTPFIILMIVIYFILGYALYAMMNAVAGATVSKTEDLNSAIMPVSMVSLVAFYLAYGAISIPDSGFAVITSIVPFSAPFVMTSRMIAGEVPVWQITASLAATIGTIILMAWISIRFYTSAVLHYGTRLKLKDLFKMSKA